MKDVHTYGEKKAKKGRTKVNLIIIYKGTFVLKQSLDQLSGQTKV